jgi:threonine/homoserine/homoserine lactone efflux protein
MVVLARTMQPLLFLTFQLIRSAAKPGGLKLTPTANRREFRQGFLTAVLNPKGMMIYVAILPQFMTSGGHASVQAAILSAAFIFWCAVVYVALSFGLNKFGQAALSEGRHRKVIDGVAGVLLAGSAAIMALA